jgi:ATP-dependent DNA helicase RecQ
MSLEVTRGVSEPVDADPRVMETLRRVWGYESLRPMQSAAIAAGLERRDALVVMPTGGGKSLCYQVPPLVEGRTDVVVSPLIALMKDQVDGLVQLGYPAAALHSGLSPDERRQVERGVREGAYRLLFVAPERLVTPWFLETVDRLGVGAFAVDEAHCISQWGHDFRPEYRQLAMLRDRFPRASLHAYTATATPRVREDIVTQLGLREPAVLVGRFDRPNLTYRIVPQLDLQGQTVSALRRHAGQAAIVYCLSRKDTEQMAAMLRANGVSAEHYHAGMSPDDRRATQERFASEQTDVVVATVAFGMGIDRGNVRCVVHATIPKSVEAYQQETGRAGRDGLPAECVMFYSPASAYRLEKMMRRSCREAGDTPEAKANLEAQLDLLRGMQRFAASHACRHEQLSDYFGQAYEPTHDADEDAQGCGACDVCLGEVEGVEDATVTAQKVLSAVARVEQRFGVGHVVDVLAGSNAQRVRELGHDGLSVHGLLKAVPRKAIQSYIYQLIDQGVLARTEDDRPVLVLNAESVEVLRGDRKVQLVQPRGGASAGGASRNASDEAAWEGVDRELFEALRELRRSIAVEKGVPAYTVLHDRSLMQIARVRPTDLESLGRVHGIGEAKLAAYGEAIIKTLDRHCSTHGLTRDATRAGNPAQRLPPARLRGQAGSARPNAARSQAFTLFDDRASIADVAAAIGRAESTTAGYLADWIADRRPASIDAWVPPETADRVGEAIRPQDDGLKPLHARLGGEIDYATLKLVIAHRLASG